MTQTKSNRATSFRKDPPGSALIALRGWPSPAPRSWHLIAGLLLFVCALAFGLYRLGVPSIWFDEAFSVELARQPLPQLWHLIFGPEPNMELYYLSLHFWLNLTSLFGLAPTEVVVRFPSVIFAALSSLLVFAIGRRFLGLSGGIVATALYLLNDLQLLYAQQTRSYSLQLLLTCLAWYSLLMALSAEERRPVRRWWLCYTLSTILAIYAHLFSVLVLLAQLFAVAGLLVLPTPWRARTRKHLPLFVFSLVAIAILIIPMLLVSLQGAKTGWLSAPRLHDVMYFLYLLTGYSKLYLAILGGCCMLGILLVLVGSLPLSQSSEEEKEIAGATSMSGRGTVVFSQTIQALLPIGWSLLCWCVVPFVVSYLVSQGSTRLFSARYLVVIVPPIMLLAALCVVALRWRLLQLVLALLLILLALRAVPYYYRSAQVEDWNVAVHWIEQHYQSGDGLVCYDNTINGSVKQGCQIAVEYYLQAYPGPVHFSSDAPGAFSWSTYSAPDPQAAVDPAALAAYATTHPRLVLIIGRVQNADGDQRVQNALHWLNSHYRPVDQFTTARTVKVYIFATH